MSKILWVDLETTGSDLEGNKLVEIGSIITDDSPELNELGDFTAVIHTDADDWVECAPVVLNMHADNGLMVDSLTASEHFASRDHVLTEWAFWVTEILGAQKRVALAGSGVAHFDRGWLDREIADADSPLASDLARRFQFWSYDIGPVRRFAKLAGLRDLTEWGYDGRKQGAGKTHRVLDDIRDHAAESRALIAAFAQLAEDH